MTTHDVLGYRVAALTLDQAVDLVLTMASEATPSLVVTLNPEIVVQARRDPALDAAIRSADLIVADGVGILWAAQRVGIRLPERVPGVELATEVLRRGGSGLRAYFLGAQPSVAERAAERASADFGTSIAGSQHGYFRRPDETPAVVDRIRAAEPDLLLAGLGPGQERFLAEHLERMGASVAIGVGGTLDVLAGTARRTPVWTRRVGLEWAWRVGLDPKRWHRIPRLLRFVALVLRSRTPRNGAG